MTHSAPRSESSAGRLFCGRCSVVRPAQVRALCCVCGTLRDTVPSGDRSGEASYGNEAAGRCLVRRRCATCGTVTTHAYLRDHDGQYRDHAERVERPGTREHAMREEWLLERLAQDLDRG